MMIKFSQGHLIVSVHEVQIRFDSSPHMRLQAQVDALRLFGNGANMLVAHDMNCQWAIKLDDETQLQEIASIACLPIDE